VTDTSRSLEEVDGGRITSTRRRHDNDLVDGSQASLPAYQQHGPLQARVEHERPTHLVLEYVDVSMIRMRDEFLFTWEKLDRLHKGLSARMISPTIFTTLH
jgi:hypothetical protein